MGKIHSFSSCGYMLFLVIPTCSTTIWKYQYDSYVWWISNSRFCAFMCHFFASNLHQSLLVAFSVHTLGVMSSQSPGTPPRTVSGQFRDSNLDVASAERRRVYYMGEGGGFPRVWVVVCFVVQSARGLSQHPRVSRKCELTTWWFVLMKIHA